MNILFITSACSWGGGERWLLDICTGLHRNGHSIYVACKPGSILLEKIPPSIAQTVVVRISGDFNPLTVAQLFRFMKSQHIDCVCTNFEKDLRVGGLAALLAGIPVISSREVDFPIKNTLLNKYFYKHVASAILVNSYATLNTLLVSAPWLKEQKIQVVWKGISIPSPMRSPQFPTEHTSNQLPPPQTAADENNNLVHPKRQGSEPRPSAEGMPLAFGENKTVVGFVGRLDEQKGIPTLLEAMRLATQTLPGLQLIMAGEGNLHEFIEQYSQTYHLEENILVAGFQNHIDSFLDAVDFVVMPSYWEGFGYTALEAMAHGKALVATHTSSLPEIIEDGKTGILIPPRSPEKLAEALIQLSNDPELRNSMGIAGTERVRKIFTLSSMIMQTESLFLEVVNGKPRYNTTTVSDKNLFPVIHPIPISNSLTN